MAMAENTPIAVVPHYRTSDGKLHTDPDAAVAAERQHRVTELLLANRLELGLPIAHLDSLARVICDTQTAVEAIFHNDLKRNLLSPLGRSSIAAA